LISRLKVAVTVLFTVTALAVSLPTAAIRADTPPPQPLWGPYVTQTTETGTVVNWKTEKATWGVVQVGDQAGYEDVVLDRTPHQLHHVSLSGLRPARAYGYRVWMLDPEVSSDDFPTDAGADVEAWLRERSVASQDGSFRTLGAEPLTFIVYGDSQEQIPFYTQMERHKLVADYVAQEEDVSFVVHLGDLTYDADDAAGWDVFFEAARAMLARTTIYPVMGNHEEYSRYYYEIFGVPEVYAFQSGEAEFLVLDTNGRADFDAQTEWIEDQTLSPADWTFVFHHHPAYSSDARNYGGWDLSRTHWEDVFREAGVSGVFSGHVHAYEHYLMRGLHHFVVGTGGGMLSDLRPDAPDGLQGRLAKTLGYAKVTVESGGATVRFLQVARISEDNREVLEIYPFGTVYDTVTLQPGEAVRALVSPEPDFRVSPPSLSIAVDRRGSSRFSLKMASSADAQIIVGTEDLPFEVEPDTLRIEGSGQPQTFELEIHGDPTSANGEYEGRLTFVRDAGDNVALGVKVKAMVSQTGKRSRLFGVDSDNTVYLLIAVVFVIAANVGVYAAYRRYKARVATTKDA
jgi:predicted phosphodiesterase